MKSCLLLLQVTASVLTMSVAGGKLHFHRASSAWNSQAAARNRRVPRQMDPLSAKGVKLLFLWVKLDGKVLQSCMCVILTVREVISLEVLCRTLKVFICEPCDLERSLAKELIMDVTRLLYLEAGQNHHYQNWEVLFWQRNNFCV